MFAEPSSRTRQILDQIDHPVIDSDGHTLEFLPAIRDVLREVAGEQLIPGFDAVMNPRPTYDALSDDERRRNGMFRMTWWGFPAENTLDRATALLPRLQYERMEELGIDYAVLYPTVGLACLGLEDPELRQGMTRAFNTHAARSFRDYADRLTHVALIPMHTPEEAIAELDHAVLELGAKAVVMSGFVFRPLPGKDLPRAARWVDTFDSDSPYDYDPVWARCVELGISPTFHSSSMGWYRASSLTNYIYNHVGNFSSASETTCRSIFLHGVPKRFPQLQFAFLEGGVGWACSLYADMISHWEKRNRNAIHAYDPKRIDRARVRELFALYADTPTKRHIDEIEESLLLLCDPDEDPAGLDEFARSGVESAEDISEIFTGQFHFGCEADDPLNSLAFQKRMNPLDARLSIVIGSDIGHWDVPDTREVLGEAWELVERGLLDEAAFRAFVFDNPVDLWTRTNPRFFEGTVLEKHVPKAD